MPYETLAVEIDEPIGRILLRRPERRNALSPQALEELAAAAADLSDRPEVRSVVVAGEGPAFCGGFDLTHWPERPDDDLVRRLGELGAEMAAAVERMRPATVAALHGPVVGGGLVLALACDLRVAEVSTRFSIPEVDLGIPLAWGGVPLLLREVGPALAKELILTGRVMEAEEARGAGLVNRVVADGRARPEAEALARLVAGKPRRAVEATVRQVDEEARSRAGDPGTEGLLAALADDEARAAAARLRRRG
jgi:enoyl-CoA hydratase/carnithine racemase